MEVLKKIHLARKETQQVSRLPLKNLENPQVYTTITGELLKEQVVTNFDDALKNSPGINTALGFNWSWQEMVQVIIL